MTGTWWIGMSEMPARREKATSTTLGPRRSWPRRSPCAARGSSPWLVLGLARRWCRGFLGPHRAGVLDGGAQALQADVLRQIATSQFAIPAGPAPLCRRVGRSMAIDPGWPGVSCSVFSPDPLLGAMVLHLLGHGLRPDCCGSTSVLPVAMLFRARRNRIWSPCVTLLLTCQTALQACNRYA